MSQDQKYFDADQKAEAFADKMLDTMCNGKGGDPAYCEDLWGEIERVLCTPDKRQRMDAIEDTTLLDLMKKAVECRVKAMVERGDFQ